MKDETVLAMVGILALAFLEGVAILCGFDGQFYLPVVAAISGIAGFALRPTITEKVSNLRST